MSETPKVIWHSQSVSSDQRMQRNGHRSCVLWFTGLSGSGKSTIANLVDQLLFERGAHTYLLDGDNVRHGLCAGPNLLAPVYGTAFAERFGLGFGQQDREENIRRVGAVTELLANAGLICLTAFVSPYRKDRDLVRSWVERQNGTGTFIEVFVNTPLDVCMKRDPKGLYQQAIEGKIKNFTGISDPYEAPDSPELELRTAESSAEQCAAQVLSYLTAQGILS
ncbi:adenylyl-sulfate kinase [Pirellulaceae bacterium SH501]